MHESTGVHLYSPTTKVTATIFNSDEGGAIISLRRFPLSTITPKQAREIARQINEIANAADQGEVGTYPQEGL